MFLQKCPPDRPPIPCFADPCTVSTTPCSDNLKCTQDYCGTCAAIFTDANGDAVTATLTGKTGRVHLYRAIAPDGTGQYLNTTAGDLYAIELEGTGLTNSLTLTPKGVAVARDFAALTVKVAA